jgi:hypothetical protein
MNDLTLFIVVMVSTIGMLVGVAYLLQKRSKASNRRSSIPAKLSPTEHLHLQINRAILVIIALLIMSWIPFRNLTCIWIAFGLLILFFLIGYGFKIYRLVEISKKKRPD